MINWPFSYIKFAFCIGTVGLSQVSCVNNSEEEIFLNCGEEGLFTAYVNLPDNSAAFESDTTRVGSSKVTDRFIQMNFEKTEEQPAMEIIINRSNGKTTHEHGSAAFGKQSLENDIFEMTCEEN